MRPWMRREDRRVVAVLGFLHGVVHANILSIPIFLLAWQLEFGADEVTLGRLAAVAVRGRPPHHPGSGRAPAAPPRATPLRAPRSGPRFKPVSTPPLEPLVRVHPARLHVRGLRLPRWADVPPAIRGGRILRVGPRPRGHWTGRVRSTRGPPSLRAHLVRVIGGRGHDPRPPGGPPAGRRVHNRGAAFRISAVLA